MLSVCGMHHFLLLVNLQTSIDRETADFGGHEWALGKVELRE
jgi:hypothetical protein